MTKALSDHMKKEINAFRSLLFHPLENISITCARQRDNGTYFPWPGPLTDSHLLKHLLEDITLGTYQLDDHDRIKWIAVDVDIAPSYRKKEIPDSKWERFIADFKRFVLQIYNVACRKGRCAYIALSGRKGVHLYLFLDSLIPATRGRALVEKIINGVQVPEGLSVELYPKQTKKGDGLGSLLKCPFGVNQTTGNRTKFLDKDFNELDLKPSDIVRNPAITIPDQRVELPASSKEIDFKIKDKLPPLFEKLLREDKQIRQLYLGKGKPNESDTSRSGYDFSLLAALIIRGITNPSDLANILMQRPHSKAKDPDGDKYLKHTINKALATFKQQERVDIEEDLKELRKRFYQSSNEEES